MRAKLQESLISQCLRDNLSTARLFRPRLNRVTTKGSAHYTNANHMLSNEG
jgi:hypothetical protein